jgi:hypothetical protein
MPQAGGDHPNSISPVAGGGGAGTHCVRPVVEVPSAIAGKTSEGAPVGGCWTGDLHG